MKQIDEQTLRCICCMGDLCYSKERLFCLSCTATYTKNSLGSFLFISDEAHNPWDDIYSPDAIVTRLKMIAKHYPNFFSVLLYIAGIFVGKSACSVINELPPNATILNIGSGVKRAREDVINVDYYPFFGVDVVADVHNLPWKDNTVDAIVAESLFEHLPDPAHALEEIHRVLRPGGILYVVTPFMLGYHSSPHDYYRWTIPGLRILLAQFIETESGVAWGPTVAMSSIFGSWISMILSFGSRTLYQIWIMLFMFILGPLSIIDYIIARFSFAQNSSHGFYFVCKKRAYKLN